MGFLTSPHLVDLILLGTVMECAILLILKVLTPVGAARMLLPGIGVMLALRAALAGAAWPWVPASLFLALIAHVFDLIGRWRR